MRNVGCPLKYLLAFCFHFIAASFGHFQEICLPITVKYLIKIQQKLQHPKETVAIHTHNNACRNYVQYKVSSISVGLPLPRSLGNSLSSAFLCLTTSVVQCIVVGNSRSLHISSLNLTPPKK